MQRTDVYERKHMAKKTHQLMSLNIQIQENFPIHFAQNTKILKQKLPKTNNELYNKQIIHCSCESLLLGLATVQPLAEVSWKRKIDGVFAERLERRIFFSRRPGRAVDC